MAPLTRTRIKICGITTEAALDAAVEAGADAVGFVFHPASPRALGVDRAAALARRLPPFVVPVGLFVDAARDAVEAALDVVPELVLQFHGDESPAACEAYGRAYLRAVAVGDDVDLVDAARRYASARGLVLDTPGSAFGGSGRAFDWSRVPASVPQRLVLAGGLDASNVGRGIAALRPWGVDVSSGVESARGVKDAQAIRRFCAAVRAADASQPALAPA